MKKFLIYILIMTLFVPLQLIGHTYCAVSTPHIVIEGEIWLYNESGEPIIMLPESYYALISNIDESYYYVTFNGISGKVDKNLVSTVGYEATAYGTSCEGTICEEYQIFTELKLKSRPDITSQDSATIPTTATITYLGSYPTADQIWYYVKYENDYGYIQNNLTSLNELIIETFIPEEPAVSTETTTEPEVTSGLNDSSLRTIIIVGLSIPAVLIIYLLFKPAKTKNYYEDDDSD